MKLHPLTCPRCTGYGEVTIYVLYPDGGYGTYTDTCAPCSGSGMLSSPGRVREVMDAKYTAYYRVQPDVARLHPELLNGAREPLEYIIAGVVLGGK